MSGPKSQILLNKIVGNGLVAVTIDKDKGSQHALRWAVENLLIKGQTVILIHVAHKSSAGHHHAPPDETTLSTSNNHLTQKLSKELFLTFHCYCTRKDIHCLDIILEEEDTVKALIDYVAYAAIENLVMAATRGGFMRKFRADTAGCVLKAAPDFCNVYVINKGKIQSEKKATRSAPFNSPLLDQVQKQNLLKKLPSFNDKRAADQKSLNNNYSNDNLNSSQGSRKWIRSPQNGRGSNPHMKHHPYGDFSDTDTDISFVSSGRLSSCDRNSSRRFESLMDSSWISNSTDCSLGSGRLGYKSNDPHEFSTISSHESGVSSSCSFQNLDEVEAEMKRLKQELKLTMDLYSNACREALSAKQQMQAMELNCHKNQEHGKVEEAEHAAEAAMSAVETERAKCKSAVEAVEAKQRIAHVDPNSKNLGGGGVVRETVEMKKILETLSQNNIKYRRYTFEEIEKATDGFSLSKKIGEGGYGPVFKCYLDHTPAAVKVLRPDAAQGRIQFLQEIEVLSCIRHPNMVLLLGACPEYGILIYEYMAKGSLDDRLFRKGNTPVLSWQLRFRIATEIATGLLFLHQTKPEPIVHRDLKPGNILLDQNYVSKISDVGLARLVPAVAENVTQCQVTSTAGTFCYIDPEYQQTGMLGVRSDVYSLGILLLQLITAKAPMGLAHTVRKAIEKGTFFTDMVDQNVRDWPIEETLSISKIAIRCAELRRKDRPDLNSEILPELLRLRDMAEEQMNQSLFP